MVPYWIPLEQRPWWTFARTPHLGRLLKKLRSQPLPPNAGARLPQWALAGCLLLVAASLVASPLLALLVFILPPIPILLPTIAARIVARDVASPHYDLIKLSTLSDRALYRGYIYAALWKMRWWIGALLAGLLPYLFGCWCIMTFAFEANNGVMSVFMLWALVNLVHLAGLLPALVGVGVAAGLRFPRADVLTVAMPLVAGLALIGGQMLGISLFNATIERTPIFVAQGTTYNYYETTVEMGAGFWLATVVYMVSPYLAWLLAMRLGSRWVRRPVG
jgi:hypothetical protein